MVNAIDAVLLCKVYPRLFLKPTPAIKNVSFSVPAGEVLGILGSNGAGKTTLIQMLLGLLTPTSGSVHFFGKELQKNRKAIAHYVNFSSTYISLPPLLTVRQALTYTFYLYHSRWNSILFNQLIEEFQLETLLDNQIKTLSSGQIAKVNIAKAMINEPAVLFLDEPTASIDPKAAHKIRMHLRELREIRGTTIVLTSHNMSEVEFLCDRALFLKKGEVFGIKKPKELAKNSHTSIARFTKIKQYDNFKNICQKMNVGITGDRRECEIRLDRKQLNHLFSEIIMNKVSYEDIEIKKPTLQDFFISEM